MTFDYRRPLHRPFLVLTAGVMLLFGTIGCSSGPTTSTEPQAVRKAENPWPIAIAALRTNGDAASSRRALTRLNTGLAGNSDVEQPKSLSTEDQAILRELVPLSDPDLQAIASASYTALDGQYLAQAFHLRAAAKAIDIGPGDSEARARAVFDWVCRQVELRPWEVTEVGRLPDGRVVQRTFSPALPPAFVLRRGSGNALERAYVVLGLLQQLGIDGGLVGPADTAGKATIASGETASVGPFFAVGIRAGKEILLFDPHSGRAFPAEGSHGVGTLSQIRANPDLLKPWRDDPKQPWKVPADDVKSATLYLTVPLTSLAPRMRTLESKFPTDAPIHLTIDPTALRNRFATETAAAAPQFWNPPEDPYTYTRTLATFLPLEEGGRDDSPLERRLHTQYERSLLPPTLLQLPSGLIERKEELARYADVVTRLQSAFAIPFHQAFLVPPTPRELLQRGLYSAVPTLVERKDEFEKMVQRVRTDRNQSAMTEKWVEQAKAVFDQLSRARLDADTNPAGVAEAQQAVENFWKKQGSGAEAMIDSAVGAAGVAEATYLIALAKHEEAIRAQIRAERTSDTQSSAQSRNKSGKESTAVATARKNAATAWSDAADWWDRYLEYAELQEASFPGRTAHAKQLANKARSAANSND